MSWLTDLAGKAEDLLNKIDQNAAVVLKDKSLMNEQLTDVIWKSTSFKQTTSADQHALSEIQSGSLINQTSSFPHLARISPSGAPSPLLRSSPYSNSLYPKRNEVDDPLRYLNCNEGVAPCMEDTRGSPSGASIPSSPAPSCGHSRSHSHGETSSVSSYTSLVREDSMPQHCFKPLHSVEALNYDGEKVCDSNHMPISDILGENIMLKNEVRSLNNELTLLHQRCKSAEREVGVAGKELHMLREVQSQNEGLKSDLQSLQLQLSNQHQKYSSACDKNSSSLDLGKDTVEEMLAAGLEKNEKLQSDYESLVEEVKELNLQISRLQAAVSEAAQQSERHRQQLQSVTHEAEQYRARATRILQDKERLITRLEKGEQSKGISNTDVLEQEVEQLREEIHLLSLENASQADLLQGLRQDLQELELQKDQNRQSLEAEIERLQNRLQEERLRRTATEEDYRTQTEELRSLKTDFSRRTDLLEKRLKQSETELVHLQNEAIHSQNSQGNCNIAELEARVRHLATALMQKQGALEALIAERNALQVHIEQTEKKKKSSISPSPVLSNGGTVVNVNENALRSRVPTLMTESPTDNKVARQVKRAYSGLDMLGIQVGVFLRRYPLARILVICYMVLLHLWVALVLFTYSPESHTPLQKMEILSSLKEPKNLP